MKNNPTTRHMNHPKGYIGWKKAFLPNLRRHCILKLLIPADARVRYSINPFESDIVLAGDLPDKNSKPRPSSLRFSKMRAERAFVTRIEFINGERVADTKIAIAPYDAEFIYSLGRVAHPKESFDERADCDCASGIHFYSHRSQAVRHAVDGSPRWRR